MHEFDLICIGSGPAGQRAAVQASKLGKRVAVVEKQANVGGVCIETGTIPSKTFREAVRRLYAHDHEDAGGSHSGPTRPTMERLMRQVAGVVGREFQVVHDSLARNDIKMFQGAARFVGPNELVVSGFTGDETLKAKKFLIAVGTRPAESRGVTLDGEIAVTSDSLLNLKRLPRSVVVVGAGVIGIEYASMFAALGLKVTVVDKRPRPLEFLDHEIVDELIHQLRKLDVTFRCGDGLKSLEISDGDRKQALLELESGKFLIAEMVLISTGRVGCTEGLGLEVVGLSADDRGRIKTDAHFQTAVPHIYAAGDVIGYPSLAATSSEQGRLAALHMFGEESAPLGDRFPIGIYSIPEISMMGETEEALTAKKVPYETGIARYNETARGQILGDHSGMFKMIFHRDTEKLLGVHCIGSGATELVHIGQAVMLLGGGLDYFINSVFNYPTLAECYKIAALNAYNKIQLIRKVQKLRQSQRSD
ncbi:MAG: Si-specific NAD(P)(+) transhydrogenase [Verrucomicrobia bacterium]|nr:Si-specific NAD(P)(+) transhydrogenase [Verrucomicrobiota bacterium]